MLKEKEKDREKQALAKTERFGIEPYDPWFGIPVFQHPFALMRKVSEELDRIFGNFTFKQGAVPGAPFRWMPDLEVEEKKGLLIVRADLPGLAREDVKVEITGDKLTIEGERKHLREEKEEGYYRSERSYGTFYRCIALPDGVNAEQAKATFTNGVLEVVVPMPEPPKGRGRTLPIEEVKATK